MGQDIIVGALALALTILPLNASGSAQDTTKQTVQKPQVKEIVVKSGDSLSSIAEEEYGSKDFWTNIWNDNPNIKDPGIIEKGDRIKLAVEEPIKAEELTTELKDRLEAKNKLAIATHNQKPEASDKNSATTSADVQGSATASYAGGPLTEAQINYLGSCESGMTASRNSGNGFYGAFQFSYGTWQSMGTGYERADMAPLEVQIDAVQRLVARSSIFTQFPGCSSKMRALGML